MKNTSLSIIILAAGKGKRMQSQTPKVLHKICGREMLYFSIKEALKLSDDVSIVVGFEAKKIQAKMKEYFDNNIVFLPKSISIKWRYALNPI